MLLLSSDTMKKYESSLRRKQGKLKYRALGVDPQTMQLYSLVILTSESCISVWMTPLHVLFQITSP